MAPQLQSELVDQRFEFLDAGTGGAQLAGGADDGVAGGPQLGLEPMDLVLELGLALVVHALNCTEWPGGSD